MINLIDCFGSLIKVNMSSNTAGKDMGDETYIVFEIIGNDTYRSTAATKAPLPKGDQGGCFKNLV